MIGRWLAIWLLGMCATLSTAQAPATLNSSTLVADNIMLLADQTLVAQGNVEVTMGEVRLRATEIQYDKTRSNLIILGPIEIKDGDERLILASAAELDDTLRRGIVRDARIILNQHLRLSVGTLIRGNGGVSTAELVAATSCAVCENQTPLWELRAGSITIEDDSQQVELKNVKLHVRGVPIIWMPRMSLPAPGVDRASGFLLPGVRSTSQLGTGLKLPYFHVIDPHRDLTIEPYLSSSTSSVGLRYRQAFTRGDLNVASSLAFDDILAQERGHIDLRYQGVTPNAFTLNVDLEGTRDDAYLLDYGLSEDDVVRSSISLARSTRTEDIRLSFAHVNSLRRKDLNPVVPTSAIAAHYERRLRPKAIGGNLRLRGDVLWQHRYSDMDPADMPASEAAMEAGGRDVTRASLAALWDRTWIAQTGLVTHALAEVYADTYSIGQDRAYDDLEGSITPFVGVGVAYPVRTQSQHAQITLSPQIQVIGAPSRLREIPNDDSQAVEFDMGNLFVTSRAPGSDLRDVGSRINTGVTLDWQNDTGGFGEINFGKVIAVDLPEEGVASLAPEWIWAGQYIWADNTRIESKINLDESYSVIRASSQLSVEKDRHGLSATHVFVDQQSDLDDAQISNSFDLTARYGVSDMWTTTVGWSFDVEDGRSRRASVGLSYANECLEVGFSISHRFTSSAIVQPTTSLGVQIELLGLNSRAKPPSTARPTCKAPQ